MVDERDRAGRTALHYAAVDDKLDVLRELIRQGADVNAKEDAGWTPLHFAANQGNLQIAEELIRAGADVNAINNEGDEPLFRAVALGKRRNARAVAALLLDNGANPYRKSRNGLIPAVFVIDLNDDEPIKRLFVERDITPS
ncbi:hypothetical protein A5717_15965 [Mycolicibacterium porcinum]|uniref:ankyrin repeat domain-containing protein n=1 Tax=Mycolicibacterium porcinum TaxID=39693 RepID=UPI00080B9CE0|nr:ankyrin repeat domain-containing protein [Mycolicibacterium porcinum]OCB12738.1 hypothetical protein A5717_15965 [Mycolicibacterium porcinum]